MSVVGQRVGLAFDDVEVDMEAEWYALTWDTDLQRFTPQIGVHPGPYTLFGLRVPLRELGQMGYAGVPSEPCVLCTNDPSDETMEYILACGGIA